MRIILNSFGKVEREEMWKYWNNHPKGEEDHMGDWEILYNEAAGYDFLKESI